MKRCKRCKCFLTEGWVKTSQDYYLCFDCGGGVGSLTKKELDKYIKDYEKVHS